MHWQEIVCQTLATVTCAVAMEFWAAWLHGRVWHHALWPIHRTHHRGRGDIDVAAAGTTSFERNDLMPLLHAPFAMALLYAGYSLPASNGSALLRGCGWGMSAFGVAYLVVHDGIAHGRFLPRPVWRLTQRWRFLRLIRSAHCLHHSHGGPPFGLFTGPAVVAAARRQRRAQGARRPAVASCAPQRSIPAVPSAWRTMP